MLAASACVWLVRDDGGTVSDRAMINADSKEGLTTQQSMQPVPSSGPR